MKKILKIFAIIVAVFIFLPSTSNAVLPSQREINLTINNMPQDAKMYALISFDLLEYNIDNEINRLEKEISEGAPLYNNEEEMLKKLKEFKETKNYIDYMKYYATYLGVNNEWENAIELRNYYIDLVDVNDITDYYEYNNKKYVEVLTHLKDNKTSIYMLDHLYNYDKLDTKFRIVNSNEEKIISLEDQKYETINDASMMLIQLNMSCDYNSLPVINNNNQNNNNQNNTNQKDPKVVDKEKTPNTASNALIAAMLMALALFAVIVYDICKQKQVIPRLKEKLKK